MSNTSFKLTKDRIQHYSLNLYECSQCQQSYYPQVHSQPYIIQFGAILVGIMLGILLLTKFHPYARVIVVLMLAYLLYYQYKERKTVSYQNKKIKYGEIILHCPQCGCDNASKK